MAIRKSTTYTCIQTSWHVSTLSVLSATLFCPVKVCQFLSGEVHEAGSDTLLWPSSVATQFLSLMIIFSPLPWNFLYLFSRLLVVILPICDVVCIFTLPDEWQIFTLGSEFLFLDLFCVYPYFLFWVALETESSSNNSSLKAQNWELEGTIDSPFCDTSTMEALGTPPHNDQFSYKFHTNCADGTTSFFHHDRQRIQKIIW